jgi:hypothetical protein
VKRGAEQGIEERFPAGKYGRERGRIRLLLHAHLTRNELQVIVQRRVKCMQFNLTPSRRYTHVSACGGFRVEHTGRIERTREHIDTDEHTTSCTHRAHAYRARTNHTHTLSLSHPLTYTHIHSHSPPHIHVYKHRCICITRKNTLLTHMHTYTYTHSHIRTHTTHYTLHTTHYTLHTTHYTLHTTHYTLQRKHWIPTRVCSCCVPWMTQDRLAISG